jgi:hypothetical protein
MRSTTGRIYLIDFGLSKQFDDNGEPESSTTIGLGTPGYAPLEQAKLIQYNIFPATLDIYALGATMYKILTGHRPADASDILNEGFPSDSLIKASRSKSLIDVVEKCMAPIKKNRFQTVSDIYNHYPKLIDLRSPIVKNTEKSTQDPKQTAVGDVLSAHRDSTIRNSDKRTTLSNSKGSVPNELPTCVKLYLSISQNNYIAEVNSTKVKLLDYSNNQVEKWDINKNDYTSFMLFIQRARLTQSLSLLHFENDETQIDDSKAAIRHNCTLCFNDKPSKYFFAKDDSLRNIIQHLPAINNHRTSILYKYLHNSTEDKDCKLAYLHEVPDSVSIRLSTRDSDWCTINVNRTYGVYGEHDRIFKQVGTIKLSSQEYHQFISKLDNYLNSHSMYDYSSWTKSIWISYHKNKSIGLNYDLKDLAALLSLVPKSEIFQLHRFLDVSDANEKDESNEEDELSDVMSASDTSTEISYSLESALWVLIVSMPFFGICLGMASQKLDGKSESSPITFLLLVIGMFFLCYLISSYKKIQPKLWSIYRIICSILFVLYTLFMGIGTNTNATDMQFTSIVLLLNVITLFFINIKSTTEE